MNLAEAIPRIAQEEGIPAEYLDAKVRIESGYNQAARSRSGAIGYGQLMPATARGLGVDPTDPESNLRGAARYLNQMYKQFGDWDLAVAAYNAGPNAVLRHGGIPPYEETRNHVRKFNEALAAPSPVLGGASAAPAGGAFSSTAPVAGSAGALQQLAQSILEGNLNGSSRPTASDPLARIAQAGLVPFAPRPVRMAASGDFFEAMAGLSGGLTEPVAAAVRSVMGGGVPANNIRPLDITTSAMASSGDLIDAGRVIDFRRDPLPSTGDHLDVRVVGPDGKYRNPANEQALLSRLLVGENPLYVDGRSAFPLTSGFGPRNIGIGSRNHRGADYAVPAGTPLRWRGGGRFTRQNGYGLVETMHNGEPFQIKLLHTTG